MTNKRPKSIILWMLGGIIKYSWFTIVYFIFPKLRWFIAMDVVFQGCRAIYFWNDATMNAGWIFLLHFGVLTLFTYFYQFSAINTAHRKF